jgi:alkylation response protein AidB-like acyl-CoA dehydrogenase
LWEQLDAMGVVGLLAPEGAGGLGLSFVDLVLVLEETGRHAVPEPIVETAAYGVPLLGRADVTIAAGESYVPWADSADVIFTTAGRFPRDDVTLVARPSVDGARRLFEVQGPAVDVDPAARLAAYDRGVCGIAAQQCGLADRMLELTADYVRERRQFGVPVGSFQAVKHHLANARIALEFARPLVYRAAASIAADDAGTSIHVSMAKAKADAAALQTARAALQCHGAIGYTTEYDLHLYLKRSWALARSWGDAAFHRSRVSRAIL